MDSPSLDIDQHKCNSTTTDGRTPSVQSRLCRPPCGKRCMSRVVTVGGQELREYRRIPCKRWHCQSCGPKKVMIFAHAAGEAAARHELRRLMTLTLDPKLVPPGVKPIKHLKHVWAKFRVPLARKCGPSVSFLWVVELHKSGMPHLHVLVNQYIPQQWLSLKWEKYGGGRIVDIRDAGADLRTVGWYLAKYLSKGLGRRLPAGERRYGASKGITMRESAADHREWELLPVGLDAIRVERNEVILETGIDEFGNVVWFRAERDLHGSGDEEYPEVPFRLEYREESFGGTRTAKVGMNLEK